MLINLRLITGLILFQLVVTTTSFGQDYRPGYIIKSNGDSVSGFVRYQSGKNDASCDFKPSRKDKRTTYNPTDLMAYGFADGRKYTSMQLKGPDAPKDKVFARIVAKGPLTLYRHDKTFYIERDSLIQLPIPKGKNVGPIEQGGNQMIKMDKRYVSILNQILADCQLKADDASYSEGDLMKLVNKYNRCKGSPNDFVKPNPLYRMNVGVLGGYVSSSLEVNEEADVPFSYQHTTIDPAKTVIGGLSLDISSPRINDKFFVTIEGWYFNATYLGRDYRGTTLQDITIDVDAIRMFFGFRYNFFHENRTPFIKAGFSGTITQDVDITSIIEQENTASQVFYSDDYSTYVWEKKVRGFWLAAGYDQLIVGKMKAFAEFRYEHASGFFGNAVNSDSKLGNVSILLGIRF